MRLTCNHSHSITVTPRRWRAANSKSMKNGKSSTRDRISRYIDRVTVAGGLRDSTLYDSMNYVYACVIVLCTLYKRRVAMTRHASCTDKPWCRQHTSAATAETCITYWTHKASMHSNVGPLMYAHGDVHAYLQCAVTPITYCTHIAVMRRNVHLQMYAHGCNAGEILRSMFNHSQSTSAWRLELEHKHIHWQI